MLKEFIILIIFMIIVIYCVIIVCDDVIPFHKSLNNKYYITPWYSTNIFKQPYTNFRIFLSRKNTINYKTTNGVGDIWFCKETKIGNVVFWTIIEEIKIIEE